MRYQHSEVFAEMKAIDENIKVNLTSLEYLQILDYYLKKSWEQIVYLSPEFVENYLCKVIAYSLKRSSIKICSGERLELYDFIFQYIHADQKKQIKLIQAMHLNRGIIFGLIRLWLKAAQQYDESWSLFNQKSSKQRFIDQYNALAALGHPNQDYLYAAYKEVEYWHKKATDFKAMICQKYTRLALIQAQKAYVQYNCRLSLNDFSIIYLMTVSKAVDRCDARFGVLTSFIQNWLKSAQSQAIKIIRQGGDAVSLEGLHEVYGDAVQTPSTYIDHSHEDYEDILAQCKAADPEGVVRYIMNIPEYLNQTDREFLESFAVA